MRVRSGHDRSDPVSSGSLIAAKRIRCCTCSSKWTIKTDALRLHRRMRRRHVVHRLDGQRGAAREGSQRRTRRALHAHARPGEIGLFRGAARSGGGPKTRIGNQALAAREETEIDQDQYGIRLYSAWSLSLLYGLQHSDDRPHVFLRGLRLSRAYPGRGARAAKARASRHDCDVLQRARSA